MSIKQRVEQLEETLGAGGEPELVVICVHVDGHGAATGPSDEQRKAKLAELMEKTPGLSTHFAVWQSATGEWHSQAEGHGGGVGAVQRH